MRLRGPFARLFHPATDSPADPAFFTDDDVPVVRHDVPYVPQAHVQLTPEASVRMLVAWHLGVAPIPMRVARDVAPVAPSTADVMAMLRASRLTPISLAPHLPSDRRWSAEALAEHLRAHGPILCTGTMHTVVLCGVDPERVFVHDPWRGRDREKPLDAFDRFLWWSDPDCMIAASR